MYYKFITMQDAKILNERIESLQQKLFNLPINGRDSERARLSELLAEALSEQYYIEEQKRRPVKVEMDEKFTGQGTKRTFERYPKKELVKTEDTDLFPEEDLPLQKLKSEHKRPKYNPEPLRKVKVERHDSAPNRFFSVGSSSGPDKWTLVDHKSSM